ncbi:hypothetical protein [Mesorhizobium sp. CAU 1741]|uniref:hypothetical protein n=1 Tax=Mesorhizobium sp. CAU 1741 TaxID=3140366 RepID=UPI00325ADFA7
MAVLANMARMTTATTGTGTITLGEAVDGFLTFAEAGITNGQTVSYAIEDGTAREVGTGVYTSSGTTLTRTVVNSTNADAAISLSGLAEVFITPLAADFFTGDYNDLANKPTLGTAAAEDIGAFATAAQGSLADSAVQPGDLAPVATSGDYDDLSGKPTIPVVSDTAYNATSWNGDTDAPTKNAVRDKFETLGSLSTANSINNGNWSGTDLAITNGGTGQSSASAAFDALKQNATTSATGVVELATDAELRAATAGKVITTDQIESASALGTLTDATTVAIDWDAFINANLVVTANRTIGNPTNVQPGTTRSFWVFGNSATERVLSWGSNYAGPLPEETVTSSMGILVTLIARSTTDIDVTWKAREA